MAKRKRVMDYEVKMQQEGRGQGDGQDYKPLYNNQDLAPKGTTTRTQDSETGRQALAISRIQLKLRKLIEFSRKTNNIKELYPINLQESQLIADHLGVKHPIEKGKDIIRPITISLLVTEEDESCNYIRAIHYVSTNSLINRSYIQELEIMRVWCREKGHKFMLVTDELLKNRAVENINMLHNYLDVENLGIEGLDIKELIEIEKWILEKIVEYDGSIRSLCMNCANILDVKLEDILSIYRHLVANQVIVINLDEEWDISKPMQTRINVSKFKELIRGYKVNDNKECDL